MATIKVYGRIHPCLCPSTLVDVQEKRLLVSKTFRSSIPRNASEIGFTFDQIFDSNSTQSDVFDHAAKDIVEKFIEGYNGTIFAYGQTGCGKTYTIEGEELSRESSSKHGLIPQTLAFIFKELQNIKDECATIKISFLEMYNETAYDLLGPLMYGTKNVRDLPKVLVSQGTGGSCLLHGLSIHDTNTEYEARKLHMNGRSNRAVAWTSSNDRSSRSHAIFTIYLTRQKKDSEVIVKSKLNLVDLAGSESLSIKKDSIASTTLNNETKHINLSLHYLETVIIALQRIHVQGIRSRSASREDLRSTGKRCQSAFIPPTHQRDRLSMSQIAGGLKCPSAMGFSEMRRKGSSINSPTSPYISYRNSLLTMVLQDSLGGNCNTAMIAALSLESHNLNETILTCRFAQRVARVTNNPVINKAINEEELIKQLQNKVTKLSKELIMLKQQGVDKNNNEVIASEDKSVVIDIVHGYLEGSIEDPVDQGINDSQKIRACLAYLKDLVIQTKSINDPTNHGEGDSGVGTNSLPTQNSDGEPCSPTLTENSGPLDNTPANDTTTRSEPLQTIQLSPSEKRAHSASSSQRFFPPVVNTTEKMYSTRSSPRSISSAPSTSRQSVVVQTERNETPQSSVMEDDCSESILVDEAQLKLILLELELKKEKLIHKSKLLSTALSNQKARIVVMEKHGCLPDEIDNERLAEQQLRRKQAEIEQRLSVVIKKIVQATSVKNTRLERVTIPHDRNSTSNNKKALKIRELELQEQSTRQKLLAYRDKLIPGLLNIPENETQSLPKSSLSPSPTTSPLTSPTSTSSLPPLKKANSSASTKHLDYPSSLEDKRHDSEKQDCKPLKVDVPQEAKPEKKRISRLLSASIRSSSTSEAKRKNTVKGSRKSHAQISLSKPFTRDSSSSLNNKQSSGSLLSKTQLLLRRRSTLKANNLNEPKMTKEMEGKPLKKASVSSNMSFMPEKMPTQPSSYKKFPCPSRTRRQAMCSTVLLSKSQPPRPQSRSGSHMANYDLEPANGFILRTNNKVYRSSSFKSDEFNFISQKGSRTSSARKSRQIPRIYHNSRGGSSEVQRTFRRPPGSGREAYHSSSGGDRMDAHRTLLASPEGTRKAHSSDNLSLRGGYEMQDTLYPEGGTWWASNSSVESGSQEFFAIDNSSPGGGEQDRHSIILSQSRQVQEDFNSSGSSTGEHYQCNVSPEGEGDSENNECKVTAFGENKEVPKPPGACGDGSDLEPSLETQNNVVPKTANVQHKVPSSVLRARRQQLERAKRIREVTSAVEVIQNAYRRYLNRKRVKINDKTYR